MPTWPATVPTAFNQDGFESSEEDNRDEFRPEVGPPMRRPRPTVIMTLYRGTQDLTNAERITLRDFYRVECRAGTLVFTRLDPIENDSARFVFETPIKFMPFTPQLWRASYTLRRMP